MSSGQLASPAIATKCKQDGWMLTEFKLDKEEDYLEACIINAGYQIENGSPSAGRHGAYVLVYGSETSGPPNRDR
jgi:hypothetical protein